MGARGLQEVDGGGEGVHLIADRADQAGEGFTHRQVVIDDEDGFGACIQWFCHRHRYQRIKQAPALRSTEC